MQRGDSEDDYRDSFSESSLDDIQTRLLDKAGESLPAKAVRKNTGSQTELERLFTGYLDIARGEIASPFANTENQAQDAIILNRIQLTTRELCNVPENLLSASEGLQLCVEVVTDRLYRTEPTDKFKEATWSALRTIDVLRHELRDLYHERRWINVVCPLKANEQLSSSLETLHHFLELLQPILTYATKEHPNDCLFLDWVKRIRPLMRALIDLFAYRLSDANLTDWLVYRIKGTPPPTVLEMLSYGSAHARDIVLYLLREHPEFERPESHLQNAEDLQSYASHERRRDILRACAEFRPDIRALQYARGMHDILEWLMTTIRIIQTFLMSTLSLLINKRMDVTEEPAAIVSWFTYFLPMSSSQDDPKYIQRAKLNSDYLGDANPHEFGRIHQDIIDRRLNPQDRTPRRRLPSLAVWASRMPNYTRTTVDLTTHQLNDQSSYPDVLKDYTRSLTMKLNQIQPILYELTRQALICEVHYASGEMIDYLSNAIYVASANLLTEMAYKKLMNLEPAEKREFFAFLDDQQLIPGEWSPVNVSPSYEARPFKTPEPKSASPIRGEYDMAFAESRPNTRPSKPNARLQPAVERTYGEILQRGKTAKDLLVSHINDTATTDLLTRYYDDATQPDGKRVLDTALRWYCLWQQTRYCLQQIADWAKEQRVPDNNVLPNLVVGDQLPLAKHVIACSDYVTHLINTLATDKAIEDFIELATANFEGNFFRERLQSKKVRSPDGKFDMAPAFSTFYDMLSEDWGESIEALPEKFKVAMFVLLQAEEISAGCIALLELVDVLLVALATRNLPAPTVQQPNTNLFIPQIQNDADTSGLFTYYRSDKYTNDVAKLENLVIGDNDQNIINSTVVRNHRQIIHSLVEQFSALDDREPAERLNVIGRRMIDNATRQSIEYTSVARDKTNPIVYGPANHWALDKIYHAAHHHRGIQELVAAACYPKLVVTAGTFLGPSCWWTQQYMKYSHVLYWFMAAVPVAVNAEWTYAAWGQDVSSDEITVANAYVVLKIMSTLSFGMLGVLGRPIMDSAFDYATEKKDGKILRPGLYDAACSRSHDLQSNFKVAFSGREKTPPIQADHWLVQFLYGPMYANETDIETKMAGETTQGGLINSVRRSRQNKLIPSSATEISGWAGILNAMHSIYLGWHMFGFGTALVGWYRQSDGDIAEKRKKLIKWTVLVNRGSYLCNRMYQYQMLAGTSWALQQSLRTFHLSISGDLQKYIGNIGTMLTTPAGIIAVMMSFGALAITWNGIESFYRLWRPAKRAKDRWRIGLKGYGKAAMHIVPTLIIHNARIPEFVTNISSVVTWFMSASQTSERLIGINPLQWSPVQYIVNGVYNRTNPISFLTDTYVAMFKYIVAPGAINFAGLLVPLGTLALKLLAILALDVLIYQLKQNIKEWIAKNDNPTWVGKKLKEQGWILDVTLNIASIGIHLAAQHGLSYVL